MNNLNTKIQNKLLEYKHIKSTIRDEEKALTLAKTKLEDSLEARKLIQDCAEATQRAAHSSIAGVVSRCLQAIFGEDAYRLSIRFVQKRGRTEAELCLVKGELTLDEPLGASGGGVIAIASFALRLAALVLSKPDKRRLLVLDEPFSALNGSEYQERVGELIESLSKELNIDFIIVNDKDWLKIGKVIEL